MSGGAFVGHVVVRLRQKTVKRYVPQFRRLAFNKTKCEHQYRSILDETFERRTSIDDLTEERREHPEFGIRRVAQLNHDGDSNESLGFVPRFRRVGVELRVVAVKLNL